MNLFILFLHDFCTGLYSNVQRILFFCLLSISCSEFTLGKHFVHVNISLIAPPETWCLLPSGVSVHTVFLPVCVWGDVGCCVSLPWLVSEFISSSAKKLWGVLNQALLSKERREDRENYERMQIKGGCWANGAVSKEFRITMSIKSSSLCEEFSNVLVGIH